MVAIKVEVHPVLAYACGRYLLALDALALLSVTVLGHCPPPRTSTSTPAGTGGR